MTAMPSPIVGLDAGTGSLGQLGTWQAWNSLVYNTGTQATTTVLGNVWASWNGITYASTGNNTVWNYWNQQYELIQAMPIAYAQMGGTWVAWNQNYRGDLQDVFAAPPVTDEQRAEENRRVLEATRLAQERVQQQKIASRKARGLLRATLTKKQLVQYDAHGYFDVDVKGRLYRVHPGNMVSKLNAEKVECRYCIHPDEYMPPEDIALCQKLLLEADEDKFLRIANRHAA